MANIIQIKRSSAHDGATAPTNLAVGELGYVQGSKELYICRSTDNTGGKEVIHAAAPRHGVNTIVTVGTIATGEWNATAIAAGKLPALEAITVPAGDVSLNSHKITSLATCTVDTDAATKGYVDSKAQGLDVKASVRLATAADLPACTYGQPASATGVGATLTANANGALTVDSVAVALNDRVLVQHQGSGTETHAHNGIYKVTTLGTGSAAWVLTRATDFDENDEVTASAFVFVEAGTINADSGHVVNTDGAITFASDTFSGVGWSQFSGAGQVTAGTGLTKAGNVINAIGTTNRITANADSIDIHTSYVGQSSITTLGTITTGTWTGTAVGDTYIASASTWDGKQSALTFGISNTNVLKCGSAVADDDFLRIDGTTIEGRTAAEVLTDIGGQASLTFGISDTNVLKCGAAVADDDFLRIDGTTIEGRTAAEVLTDIGASASVHSHAVGSGGTGLNTLLDGAVMLGNGTNAVTMLAKVAAGQLLTSGGTAGGDHAAWSDSLSGITIDCGTF